MTQIAAGWLDVLSHDGVERIVAGNSPFLLDRPDTVWVVRSGRVEVFSVAIEDGVPKGARHHFFSAESGDLLFGIDQDRYGEGQGLLAVGVVGTRVLELPFDRIRELMTTADAVAPLAQLVDRWVSGLSAGVARGIVPHPRADVLIQVGDRATLAAGKRLRTQSGIAWMRHDTGSSLFVGMEDLADVPAGAWFPVTHETWLQALEASTFVSTSTAEALASDAGWRGLEAFYGLMFRCEFFNTRLMAADELNRLKAKADRDRAVREHSLRELASVLEPPRDAVPQAADGDPLFAACTLVGAALDFVMKPAPPRKEEEHARDPLAEIARASRVRTRRVVLKGEWWRHETGPLLAYLADGNQPVAIVPHRNGGRLDLVDPVKGERRSLRRANAGLVAPVAFSFYRPFPDRVLTPWDILRFGTARSGRDVARPVLLGLSTALLGMLAPFLTGLLIDSVIPESRRTPLLQIAVVLGLVSLVSTSFDMVRNLSLLRMQTKLSASIQPALWDRLLALPAAFFRSYTAGDLAMRVNSVDAIRQVLSGVTLQTLMTSVFSLAMVAQMFYYSTTLALWGLGVIVIAIAAVVGTNAIKLRYVREIAQIDGAVAGLVLQLLNGIGRLRVTGAENHAFAEWARRFAVQRRLAVRATGLDTTLNVFNAALPLAGSMLIFAMALPGSPHAPGALSPGDIVAFNTAFGTLLVQMIAISTATLPLLQAVPLYERARPIFESLPEVDPTKSDPGDLSGRIEVDHVTFRYHADGPAILEDVTVRLEPGEFVAIVGPSGSGKSTLLRLLLGLDAPESGSIFYDGKNLALLDVQKLRRRMGVVMQTGRVRAGSIFDNIIGSAPYTLDDAWEAARLAGFDEDIRQMPMGMHTVLQAGGGTLSGGQRQRLMIARALIQRPRIIFFDEATSALDNRTQAVVSKSLQELQATRVAIAHRLSTIIDADRIYVLAAGRIVETGTYAELVATQGLFADLVRRQML